MIKTNDIKALLLTAAKAGDIRGLDSFVILGDKLVSTDGHRLTAIKHGQDLAELPHYLIISREVATMAVKMAGKSQTVKLEKAGEGWALGGITIPARDKHVIKNDESLARVMPEPVENAPPAVGYFDVNYIKDAYKALNLLDDRAWKFETSGLLYQVAAGRVGFIKPYNKRAIIIIMPMRAYDDGAAECVCNNSQL